jgi:signal transduction histidine kinase/ActR/RegA family two-component response regulator
LLNRSPQPRGFLDVALIAASLLPLLVFAGLAVFDYGRTREDAEASVRTKLEILHRHASKVLEINALLLERVSERFDPLSIEAIRQDEARHHGYLSRLKDQHRDVAGISVIGADGFGAAHSHLFPVPPANASDRDYFLVHRAGGTKGLYVSAPLFSRLVNEPGFVISRARRTSEGRFDGIYNASIRSKAILDFWREAAQYGESEIISLVRSDGTVLVRYPGLDADASKLGPDTMLMKLMESNSDYGFMNGVSPDGKARIVAARRLDELPVWLFYGIDRDVAFAAWRRDVSTMAAMALSLTGVLVMLALMVRRRTRLLIESNDDLQRVRSELEEANRAKDEFIAALAHELRNPLAAIANSVFVMNRSSIEGRAAKALHIVGRQVTLLRRLVDDLLDTARSVHGKLRIAAEPLELRALCSSVAESHAVPAGSLIQVSGVAAWVAGDVERLHQVLDNLIDNAIKYGGTRIAMRVGTHGGNAVLDVEDDGEGMEAELIEGLFEPFKQGPQTLARTRGGLGLGLALARRLVDAHGGSISAASPGRGRGSRFTVTLPLAARPAPATGAPPGDAGVAARRVVIVEDQPDGRESLKGLLELDGHEVSVAGSGPEGLALILAARPDVALIDIGLPGFDGYELVRRLRIHSPHGLPRFVALTGYGQAADRRAALEAGFDAHLTKPVTPEALARELLRGAERTALSSPASSPLGES